MNKKFKFYFENGLTLFLFLLFSRRAKKALRMKSRNSIKLKKLIPRKSPRMGGHNDGEAARGWPGSRLFCSNLLSCWDNGGTVPFSIGIGVAIQ